ncbi:MAG: hypothetical protein O3C67_06320 [Cyanobacteria bacterium]|nr:hypothetical protein [Cyanobacteriota bacterium]
MSQSRHSIRPTQQYSAYYQAQSGHAPPASPRVATAARTYGSSYGPSYGSGYGPPQPSQGHPQRRSAIADPYATAPNGAPGVDWATPRSPRPAPGTAGVRVRTQAPRRPVRRVPRQSNVWLASAGGGAVALALVAVVPQVNRPAPVAVDVCQQVVESQSVLGREELSELLAIPERASREAVEQVIAKPYCVLNATEVREGVTAEREAYPLAFDPQTWFVVLYEDGEYAGYDFSFTREAP